MSAFSFGLGIGTKNQQGTWLEVYYAAPLLNPSQQLVDAVKSQLSWPEDSPCMALDNAQMQGLAQALEQAGETNQAALAQQLSESARPLVVCLLNQDQAPSSASEVYLKLHLLSHRLVKPHDLNLTGMFGLLANVAWTSEGAIDINELPQRQLQARIQGRSLSVDSVDKFPKMTDYVVPSGVRIADTARVRLGAYVGEGTTVMHEGFINFNAGTLGVSMIEGRISAGVTVANGSDLGGGCSTMGTLSGGNNVIISIGENCLVGANAGVGIPLGDRCTIEAGLYVTAGAKVDVLDDNRQAVETLKARDLAGKSDLLFRRNSSNGRIECLTNKSAIELNSELHSHN